MDENSLPVMASEDFSFYINEIPGCFYFLGNNKEGAPPISPHSSYYQFNDNLLSVGASLYAKILENRFEFKFV